MTDRTIKTRPVVGVNSKVAPMLVKRLLSRGVKRFFGNQTGARTGKLILDDAAAAC